MDEAVSLLPTVLFLWLLTLLGIGTALLGVDQIGASAAVHLGAYRAAQASAPVYGQHIAAGISLNYTGADLTGQSAWGQDALGRTVQANLHYEPSLSWMIGGRRLT